MNINRVSPVLKRFIPGELFSKNSKILKNTKKESDEKDEEDNKIRGDARKEINSSDSFPSKNDPHQNSNINLASNHNINIKNVVSVQRNDINSYTCSQSQPGISIINSQMQGPAGGNMSLINNQSRNNEKELDKLVEKIILRETESGNQTRRVNFYLDNIFKTGLQNTQMENIKIISRFEFKEKGKIEISLGVSEKVVEKCKDDESPRFKQLNEGDLNESQRRKRAHLESIDSQHSHTGEKELSTKNIFKTHRQNSNNEISIEEVNVEPKHLSKNDNTPSFPVENLQKNIQIPTKKYSLFDRFFIIFKQSCYTNFKVNATISQDKRDFAITYKRKNNDMVLYKIIYDHENQQITFLEKIINQQIIYRNEEEENLNNSQWFAEELKSIIDDIIKNVEKK